MMKFAQRNIVGNHIAIVGRGRGGSKIRILDAAANSDSPEDDVNIDHLLHKLDCLMALMQGRTGRIRTTPMPSDMQIPTTDSRELTMDEMRDSLEERDRRVALEYSNACNAIGEAQRQRREPEDCRPALRRRATDARDDFDWADKINQRGRELRERR